MGTLLFAMGAPLLLFGAFALLALRFGAESRPWFDERPVVDDRPNWFPIPRMTPPSTDGDDVEPRGGEPADAAQPVTAPAGRRTAARPRPGLASAP